jgi:hypothetical protein
VQHRVEQQPGGLGEVDQAGDCVAGENVLRLAQVGFDDVGVGVRGEDGPAVCDRDLVDVGVDDAGGRICLLGDLVHVALGRDARPDVQELVDPARRQEADGTAEERAVGTPDRPGVGLHGDDRPGHILVGEEVMAAA